MNSKTSTVKGHTCNNNINGLPVPYNFLQTLGYKVMGRAGLVVIPILVAMSTFGTANIVILTGSR